MGLLERISGREPQRRSITTIDDYAELVGSFGFGGANYPLSGVQQTMPGDKAERIPHSLVGYAQHAFGNNAPVFAVMAVRQLIFSSVRFRWQRLVKGKPSDMFGSASLGLLERPWFGGTTQDLLNKTIQFADLAGNAYGTADTPYSRLGGDDQGELVPLRPDWVDIAVTERMVNGGQLGWRRVGYLYTEGGPHSGNDPVPLLRTEVSHFAPIPDPLATYRGMSWLTPIIREIQNDGLMSRHQKAFFENRATPNLVVKVPATVQLEAFKAFKAEMDRQHSGPHNAGKTLYLGGGADVTVVGQNFDQMQFADLTAVSETRIASAGGVPPVIAGFMKGLESSTYSNYSQARRRLSDGTMHPLWQNVAGSLEPLVEKPPSLPGKTPGQVRLWYDATDVPFLREDEKDHADIQFKRSQTIRQFVDAGFTPESAVAAVENSDNRLLVHTGLFSVQLQKPGAQQGEQPTDGGSDA